MLAEYDTPGELIEAAAKVRDAGYTEFDCYSPFPVHGIDEAMGIKRTILPLLDLRRRLHRRGRRHAAAVVDCNAYNWPWNISGKPTWSIPANIPIAFETHDPALGLHRVLRHVDPEQAAAGLAPVLPHRALRPRHRRRVLPRHRGARTSRFDADDDARAAQGRRRDRGRERATSIRIRRASAMPKWITAFIVASTAFALIPFAIAAKARNSHSSEPHIHIFPDMDFQPKYKSDTRDGPVRRRPREPRRVAGTVARGSLKADDDVLPRPRATADVDDRRSRSTPVAARRRRRAARARPEALQHLLHAVPRLRRPRHGHGARSASRRSVGAWRRANLVEPERRQVAYHDAERPALQHDLERLQHDDGLRGARSRTRTAGRSSLYVRALAARAERARRTTSRPTSSDIR